MIRKNVAIFYYFTQNYLHTLQTIFYYFITKQ